ncbi:hypothetical protein PM082_003656 [Marasmius tenuissimus]|nr:hypothetical protein PM082_003656 [Marasmius tenuissimus]
MEIVTVRVQSKLSLSPSPAGQSPRARTRCPSTDVKLGLPSIPSRTSELIHALVLALNNCVSHEGAQLETIRSNISKPRRGHQVDRFWIASPNRPVDVDAMLTEPGHTWLWISSAAILWRSCCDKTEPMSCFPLLVRVKGCGACVSAKRLKEIICSAAGKLRILGIP